MPGYAAIVLYFRAGDILGATLDAVLRQSRGADEVLVVDNASGDGVAEATVRERPGVRLLTLEHNEGYAGGMNRGVAALRSTPTHLLFLTHEAELDDGAAEHLLDAAVDLGASACGPLLHRHLDGSVWSAGGTLSARGATAHLQSPRYEDLRPYEVDWLDGAVTLIDRHAFESIGGFDERFFLYWEDVDVCVRLRKSGPVICAPAAAAAQDTGSTPPYYASRNRVLFWKAHGSGRHVANAFLGELGATRRDVVRRHPRPKDAAGRLLGLVDAATGALHPRFARVRTRAR